MQLANKAMQFLLHSFDHILFYLFVKILFFYFKDNLLEQTKVHEEALLEPLKLIFKKNKPL